MIYQVLWQDGRQLLIRANDEENARQQALEWRLYDPLREKDVPVKPVFVTHVVSRGRSEIIQAGWAPARDVERNVRTPLV